jgi:hypothetical protein
MHNIETGVRGFAIISRRHSGALLQPAARKGLLALNSLVRAARQDSWRLRQLREPDARGPTHQLSGNSESGHATD